MKFDDNPAFLTRFLQSISDIKIEPITIYENLGETHAGIREFPKMLQI